MKSKRFPILPVLILLLSLLLIAAAVLLIGTRATPKRVVGTWVSTETVYLPAYSCDGRKTLVVLPNGSYLDTLSNAGTGEVLDVEEGTWTTKGNRLNFSHVDTKVSSPYKPTVMTTWKYFFGTMKNGYWKLEKLG